MSPRPPPDGIDGPPLKRQRVEPPSTASSAPTRLDGTMDSNEANKEPATAIEAETEQPQPQPHREPANPRAGTTHTAEQTLEKELRVGIEAYVSPGTAGFTGVLKQRYTDFLVNEILPGGEVCHLKSLGDDSIRESIKLLRVTLRGDGGSTARPNNSVPSAGTNSQEQANGTTDEAPEPICEDPGSAGETPAASTTAPAQSNGDARVPGIGNEDGGVSLKVENDAGVAEDMEDVTPNKAHPPEEKETPKDLGDISDEDIARLKELFGERTGAILRLHSNVLKHPDWRAQDFSKVVSDPIEDKTRRTKAHQAIRDMFSSRLESATFVDDCITIKAMAPTQRGRGGRGRGGRDSRQDRSDRPDRVDGPARKLKGKLGWSELGGEYLHFTLYKENKDTMESISWLGHQLNVTPKNFQFAGTKDRRGVTAQRVCVKRVQADQLSKAGRTLRNAKIGDFAYHTFGLDLGDLFGNEFVITLRDCHFDGEEDMSHAERLKLADKIVTQAIADFTSKGFINYYGLQRFGTFIASTDEIGVKLLQDDLGGAIDRILDFSPALLDIDPDNQSSNPVSADDIARANALYIWKTTGNSNDALAQLPRRFAAETAIIRHLGKGNKTKDYQGALMMISRNLRLMYVHAYQSLVWNAVASKRYELFGDQVVEGDLVLVSEHKDMEGDPIVVDEVDQAGEEVVLPATDDRATNAENEFERARALTKEEVESGNYSVFDVVLPLPGWDVEYPANAIGAFYKEFMGSEKGGGLDPNNMRRQWKEISLSGSYRKLLGRPGPEMHGEVKGYSLSDEQLVVTDMDRLIAAQGGVPDRQAPKSQEQDDVPDAEKKIAVIVKMKLGSSMYATMALRELMKHGGVRTYKPEYSGRT